MTFGPRKLLGSAFLAALTLGLVTFELLGWSEIVRVTLGVAVAATALIAVQTLVDTRRIRRDVSRSQARSWKATKALLSEHMKLAKDEGSVTHLSESVHEVRVTSESQLQELQHLRSDIEWLEQVLVGVTNSLSEIPAISASRDETEEPPQESDISLDELRHALQESLVNLQISAAENRKPTLQASPELAVRNHSARRIDRLIAGQSSTARYLEIGLELGKTFEAVHAATRVGIDPLPRFDTSNLPEGCQVFVGRSDDFFELSKANYRFDVIFVDGLHVFEQAYRDLMNAIARLNPGGSILVDDVVPSDPVSALPDLSQSLSERRARGLKGSPWHGDVYKLVPALRDLHPEMNYRTIIGSGNEQLLVWPKSSSTGPWPATPDLSKYAHLGYDEVFGSGIPDYFCPVSEDEAILAALEQEANADDSDRT